MTTVPTGRIPRLRWGVGVSWRRRANRISTGSTSVAAPQLKHDFGLTDRGTSLADGFFWSYALLQIPTGMILDRFGVTWVNRIGTVYGPSHPPRPPSRLGSAVCSARACCLRHGRRPLSRQARRPPATGSPRQERAFATSIFDAAAKFSNVIGVPLVALAVVNFGWRWGFGITALPELTLFPRIHNLIAIPASLSN